MNFQILGTTPPGVLIIGCISMFAVLIVVIKYRYKMDIKSVENRVLLLYSIGMALFGTFLVIIIGILNSEFILVLLLMLPVFSYVVYSLLYILNKIRGQEFELKNKQKRLKDILNNAEKVAISVANMATELSASASEVNASSEEISQTTVEVSKRSKDQDKALAHINKMTTDIKNIAKFITNISEQTNLLALNASIEAGRAGEHGRGFAVVAEKVQKLAEESKTSVDQTSSLIETIVKNLGDITHISEDVSRAMEEISSGTEEQVASMEEISATAKRLESLAEELKISLIKKIK